MDLYGERKPEIPTETGMDKIQSRSGRKRRQTPNHQGHDGFRRDGLQQYDDPFIFCRQGDKISDPVSTGIFQLKAAEAAPGPGYHMFPGPCFFR